MNQHYLKRLEGLVIDTVLSSNGEEPTSGQHVLRIGDYTLNVMNRFELIGIDKLDHVKGLRIEAVLEVEDAITVMLQNSIRIVVDLRDEAYFGPEALVLHGPNELIVVWN